MSSTYYLKDFYDDIKSKQQDLINNHSTCCQTGGYFTMSQHFDKLNAQQELNNIRREVQKDLNSKITNIMKKIQVGGGSNKMTLGENIKLLKKLIKEQCKIEKNLLINIKKQQKSIKLNKLGYLSKYQSEFKVEYKKASKNNKDIKKLQLHIHKIIYKKNIKLKTMAVNDLVELKKKAKMETLDNLKSIINKIKQR
jgi:hypothetical protein